MWNKEEKGIGVSEGKIGRRSREREEKERKKKKEEETLKRRGKGVT